VRRAGKPRPKKRKIGYRPAFRLLSISGATGMIVPRPRPALADGRPDHSAGSEWNTAGTLGWVLTRVSPGPYVVPRASCEMPESAEPLSPWGLDCEVI